MTDVIDRISVILLIVAGTLLVSVIITLLYIIATAFKC